MSTPSESKRDELLARHAAERAEAAQEAEKARARIPRKERARRARLAEDLAAASAALAARHAEELAEAGVEAPSADAAGDSTNGDGAALVSAMGGLMAGVGSGAARKESKAARRRRQKAEAEVESERRVAEEKAGMGPSERLRETEAIVAQLTPLELRIHDIPPDGHCLYAAFANQLAHVGDAAAHDVGSLRAAAADHLLARRAEYMPFLEEVEFDETKYDLYCERLRKEAVWGGQVELRALSTVLQRRVEVFAADMPLLVTGEEFSSDEPLRLSFHRHYYNLGDHYNSVVGYPAVRRAATVNGEGN